MKNNFIKSKEKGLVAFSILLFFTNFLTKVCKEIFDMNIRFYPSTLIKLVITLLLLFYAIRIKNKYVIILLIVFGLSLSFSFFESRFYFQPAYEQSLFFFKSLFFITLIVYLKNKKTRFIKKIINTFITISKINFPFILIGFFLRIEILKSYPFSERFGYNGLFPEPGISSYFYISLLAIAFYDILNKETKVMNTLIAFISALLLGTKASYLFIIILALFFVLEYLQKKTYQVSFIALLTFLAIVFYKKMIQIFIFLFYSGTQLYKEYGIFTLLTSTRDLLFVKSINHIKEKWSLVNYLIGSVNLKNYRVEFSFVDLFLFYGFLGLFIYLVLIWKTFFVNKDKLFLILILSVLFISAFSGNLFFSITNSFTFVVTFLYLSKKSTLQS